MSLRGWHGCRWCSRLSWLRPSRGRYRRCCRPRRCRHDAGTGGRGGCGSARRESVRRGAPGRGGYRQATEKQPLRVGQYRPTRGGGSGGAALSGARPQRPRGSPPWPERTPTTSSFRSRCGCTRRRAAKQRKRLPRSPSNLGTPHPNSLSSCVLKAGAPGAA